MKRGERVRIFDDWLARHSGLLFKVVWAFAGTPHDREDLFQQIALQLWQSIPRYTEQVAVTTWLYRVAFYTANGWKRQENRRKGRMELLGDADAVLIESTRRPDPRLEALFQQLAKLNDIDRSIGLMLLDGLSYREISAVIGVSESNVGVRIHRLKRTLAQSLAGDRCYEI